MRERLLPSLLVLLVVLAVLAVPQAWAHDDLSLTDVENETLNRRMTEEEKEALISPVALSGNRYPVEILWNGDASGLLYPLPANRTPNDGIPNDGGWLLVDFCTAGATGAGPAQPPDCHHNDDDSAVYSLAFTFDFYATPFSQVYINNNGNLSFGQLFSTFTATGFPVSDFPMVAPFWGDVDTGDQYDPPDKPGHVWYKFFPAENAFVVTWDGVGYYNENDDKKNMFQVAISDGWSTTMGIGNNVCFSYGDMQWTTGDASGGYDGFGGVPATVGVNRGNGVDFAQIGRFDHPGTDYDGPGGNADGVSYLDNKQYCFNVSGVNVPPVPQGFPPANTAIAECDVPFSLQVGFISPELNQTTTITVADVDNAQSRGLGITTAAGNPATVALSWTPSASDVGTYELVLTAEDDGTPPESTDVSLFIVVECPNQPPVADPGGPYAGEEGSTVAFDGSGSWDPDGDPLTYSWDFGDGTSPATGATPSHTYADNGTYTVCLTVEDDGGLSHTQCTTAVITNVAPTVIVSGPSSLDEGQAAVYSATVTDPGILDTHTVVWDCDGDGFDDGGGLSMVCTFPEGPAIVAVRAQATDNDGGTGIGGLNVTVANVAPTVGPITVDPILVQVGVAVTASADFTDPGLLDTHTAEWSWGDSGSDTQTGVVSPVTASHAYTAAGIYTITLTVTDDDGGSGQSAYQYVIVYNPNGGFVTGGGWINSPPGACRFGSCTPDSAGRANFGFVCRYRRRGSVLIGQTEFNLKVGELNFHSSGYDWLVVSEATAIFKGEGTINGDGSYGVLISVVDASFTPETEVDLFRIKIWDRANGDVVYDNEMGAPEYADATAEIGGGNIVIH